MDYVVEHGVKTTIGVNSLAHLIKADHALEDEYDSGTCWHCEEKVGPDGLELLSALAVKRDEAELDTKWAGLTVDLEDDAAGARLRFSRFARPNGLPSNGRPGSEHEDNQTSPASIPPPAIGLLDAFWPQERVTYAKGMAERLIRDGDLVRASELMYGVVPRLEEWSMMRVVADRPTRKVLKDYEGQVWIAVPIESANLDGTENTA